MPRMLGRCSAQPCCQRPMPSCSGAGTRTCGAEHAIVGKGIVDDVGLGVAPPVHVAPLLLANAQRQHLHGQLQGGREKTATAGKRRWGKDG